MKYKKTRKKFYEWYIKQVEYGVSSEVIKKVLLAKAEPTSPVGRISEDKTVEGKIEPPKNIRYLNSDLKRWAKEITEAVNHLTPNAKTK